MLLSEVERQQAASLTALLEYDNHETRKKLRQKVFSHPSFIPRYDISLKSERELALDRLRLITDNHVISVLDFEKNPLNIFTVHELVGTIDGSVATKMTVQFNLFGGTIIKLGTDRHRWILSGIDNLNEVGCFALTELGYGNNAIEMETTAVYDHPTCELIIHTPTPLAQKYWITNSAVHAKWAVVFAQLQVNQQQEGIHAILVRIRNDDMTVAKGVTIEDMGKKFDLNGVDNGKLWFNQVRVPVKNLLNRYSDINEDGKFISSIGQRRQRFLKVADQLLSGRLCIASMCNGGLMLCLAVAVRYAMSRKTVGRSGQSDTPIFSYQIVQNAYIPLISRQYLLHFGLQYVKQRWVSMNQQDFPEVVRLCCVIKPLITWHVNNAATTCRERSGGQGYLACNQFNSIIGTAHAGMTAEGDNTVLMQKVTKELLADIQSGKISIYKGKKNFKTSSNPKELTLQDFQEILRLKEAALCHQLISNLTRKLSASGTDLFDVWMGQESRLILEVAKSFGERMCMDYFVDTIIVKNQSITNKPVLENLGKLYAVQCIQEGLAWYISIGNILNNAIINLLPAYQDFLVKELAPFTLVLIQAYSIPDSQIFAPIAKDWVTFNKVNNQGEILLSKL